MRKSSTNQPQNKPQNTASAQVAITIKQLLKKGGFQQKDLARSLKVSLPTAKRQLNGQELGLERLVEIADFFHLSIYELLELSKGKRAEAFPFRPEQETYLAKNLLNLIVFRAYLRGYQSNAIRERYSLSKAQLEKILIGLDKVGLVEFWSEDRVRLKAKWPFKWIDGGPLQKNYMPLFIRKVFAHTHSRSGAEGGTKQTPDNFFRPFELALRPSSAGDLKKELQGLLEKYRALSKFELVSHSPEELLDLTGLLACDHFAAWDELWKEGKP